MKDTPAALKAAMANESMRLATCWKLTRKDGLVLGFTDCSLDLLIDGVLYAASTGYTPSALATSGDLSVNNQEASGVLSSDTLTDADILGGKWDGAAVQTFTVNYQDLSMGIQKDISGKIGQIQTKISSHTSEIRSLTQSVNEARGRTFGSTCDAELGDSRCKIDMSARTFTGAITALDSLVRFQDSSKAQPGDYFTRGTILFTSGANAGQTRRCKLHESGGWLTLGMECFEPLVVGDQFTVSQGCDWTAATCHGVFDNMINFRGFNQLPGRDALATGK